MMKLLSLLAVTALLGGCASYDRESENGRGAPGGTTVYGSDAAGIDNGAAAPESSEPELNNERIDNTVPDNTYNTDSSNARTKGPL